MECCHLSRTIPAATKAAVSNVSQPARAWAAVSPDRTHYDNRPLVPRIGGKCKPSQPPAADPDGYRPSFCCASHERDRRRGFPDRVEVELTGRPPGASAGLFEG
jgi:hypothetical protein